ncbi:MAG: hypothetical protein LBM00_02990 [Deltaproteobacteria bacterium]|jgi:hypothetical protein|nr:hypothetical protein [Deltaproteobacteria bacterium]
MPASALQSDFTGGELSPALSARVEFAKYGKGCRTLKNFIVQSQGGAVKRPGFELLDRLPGPACLIPFAFNNEQAYCLVLGENWLAVATHEGFILENGVRYQIRSSYTLEQAERLSYVQSGDVLFLACHGVPPYKLMRYGHADWRFEAMVFTPPLPPPEWDTRVDTAYSYALDYPRPNTGPFNPPPDYAYARSASTDENGATSYAYAAINYDLYKQSSSAEVTVAAVAFVNGAKKSDDSDSPAQLVTPYTYYVTAVDSRGRESELSEGASITGPSSNNWQAGDYMTLAWKGVPGAEEYRVYKSSFSGRPGYLATVKTLVYQDYNASPLLSEGAPKYEDPFPDGDYPGCVCLFEQRLVFASSLKRPQTIWMSKSGDYNNFAVYTPVTDDAPIELTLAGQEVSEARWMAALRSLIMGFSGLEWEITGRGDAAFSAKNAKASPQSYWGSSLKQAMIIGNIILHVSSSGSQVRSLQYDFGSDSYGGLDLSVIAAHLLEKHRITGWAYQKNPDSIVWCVRSDGALLGLTFQAEHQIAAWHRHETQGRFKAVCAVPHGFEHSLFAVVERESALYLERMAERYTGGEVSGSVFMDCSLTHTGAPVQTIYGLEHLEGREVGILADGAVMAPRKVENGRINLDYPASLVTVGLLYTADLETMPVEFIGASGSSVALKKQINAVDLFFRDSLGVQAGLCVTPGKLEKIRWQEVKWRTNEPYGKPPAPFNGIKQITTANLADNSLTVCVRSESPTPVTVLALVSRMQVNQ